MDLMENDLDLMDVVVWQIIYAILMVITVTGNFLILFVIGTTARLRVQANVYITALAVADMTVGLYRIFTIFWINDATHGYFIDNYNLCQSYATVAFVLCEASIIILLTIAVDRFVYILYPFVYQRLVTTKRMVVFIVSACPLFVVHSAWMRFAETTSEPGCGINIMFAKTPVWTNTNLGLYIIISVTNFTLYAMIFRKATQQAKSINAVVVSTQTSRNKECEKRRMAHNVRLVKRMAMVCGIFFSLWTPYFVMSVVRFQIYVPGDVKMSAALLGQFNSSLNFVVYAYQDPEFRAALKNKFGRAYCPSQISSSQTL